MFEICFLICRYVVFTVLDHGSEDDSLLGHVVVDLDNLDIERGYQGAFPLSDMVGYQFLSLTCCLKME